MRNIFVQLVVQQLALPDGVEFDHIDITVTDINGVESTQAVNGHESPAYKAIFSVPEGLTKAKAQAFSTEGDPLGPPLSGQIDVPAVKTFPQAVGITLGLVP